MVEEPGQQEAEDTGQQEAEALRESLAAWRREVEVVEEHVGAVEDNVSAEKPVDDLDRIQARLREAHSALSESQQRLSDAIAQAERFAEQQAEREKRAGAEKRG